MVVRAASRVYVCGSQADGDGLVLHEGGALEVICAAMDESRCGRVSADCLLHAGGHHVPLRAIGEVYEHAPPFQCGGAGVAGSSERDVRHMWGHPVAYAMLVYSAIPVREEVRRYP